MCLIWEQNEKKWLNKESQWEIGGENTLQLFLFDYNRDFFVALRIKFKSLVVPRIYRFWLALYVQSKWIYLNSKVWFGFIFTLELAYPGGCLYD